MMFKIKTNRDIIVRSDFKTVFAEGVAKYDISCMITGQKKATD